MLNLALTIINFQMLPKTVVQAAVASQRDARSHKLNVRLRAHWGCHDLTALNPPEVSLQLRTAADGLAI